MPSSSKRKGNVFESELVKLAQAKGLSAKRAWGSNGESLGLEPDVDVLLGGDWPVQAKRRKKLADYLKPPESCRAAAFRQDRGQPMVLISYDDLCKLLVYRKLWKNNCEEQTAAYREECNGG